MKRLGSVRDSFVDYGHRNFSVNLRKRKVLLNEGDERRGFLLSNTATGK